MFFQYKIKYFKYWLARKKKLYSCVDGKEKSVPRDHQFSLFSKPRDANQ